MSLLIELIVDLFSKVGEPSTERGLVDTVSAGSVVLAGATVWLLATIPLVPMTAR